MKRKIFLSILLLFCCCTVSIFSQNNIYDIIDKEIVLYDNWAGQSITLVYENGDYFIYRKIYGSGVSIVGTIKYSVIFDSEYKITFFEIISISKSIYDIHYGNEMFEILLIDKMEIYLNGIKIDINCIIE